MLRKSEIYDKIVFYLSTFEREIEVKASNNLLDDNVMSENFIKDLLNECMGWNLINLNDEQSNYPGIDLGDRERHIGVQISSTKTGTKIKNSLDKMVANKVDLEFNEIYFFILGKKQGSYSIKFEDYTSLDCGEANIWDIQTLKKMCQGYDAIKMQRILNILERELVIPGEFKSSSIPDKIRVSAIELQECMKEIFAQTTQLLNTRTPFDFNITSMENGQDCLNVLLQYMDDVTYKTCKKVIDDANALLQFCKNTTSWGRRLEFKCENIMSFEGLLKNLQAMCGMIYCGKKGLTKELPVIIDGDNLVERLTNESIKHRFIYEQFSIEKMNAVIEARIYRKCKQSHIWFSNSFYTENPEFVTRLQSEGTIIHSYEDRLMFFNDSINFFDDTQDALIVSADEKMFSYLHENLDKPYLYGISIKKDMPSAVVPYTFSICDIHKELNRCFTYHEEIHYDIRTLTLDEFRTMISNGNDIYDHQIRVNWSGKVYLSLTVAAENIEDLKFRWETYDAGNGFVGPICASDDEYTKKEFDALKRDWENDRKGYIDSYFIC